MSPYQKTATYLIVLAQYEPSLFLDEIKEISDAIKDNRSYDESPELSHKDLISLLENIEIACNANISSHGLCKTELSEIINEYRLRTKIRNILRES